MLLLLIDVANACYVSSANIVLFFATRSVIVSSERVIVLSLALLKNRLRSADVLYRALESPRLQSIEVFALSLKKKKPYTRHIFFL